MRNLVVWFRTCTEMMSPVYCTFYCTVDVRSIGLGDNRQVLSSELQFVKMGGDVRLSLEERAVATTSGERRL